MNNQANRDIRDAFFDRLYDIAAKDKNVIFMTADMGALSLEKFKRDLPEQYINVGISEQNLISVAAGLALTGKKVFVYAITSFITQRCYEQIRVDLCGMNLPVTIIGSGPGLTYGSDGSTHHAIEDVAIMRALPNLTILSPCDAISSSAVAKFSYDSSKPVYVRLDKGKLPAMYKDANDLSEGLSLIRAGKDVAIITTEVMVHNALAVADELHKHSISASVLDIFKIKPVNEQMLIDRIGDVKLIVALEEHLIDGGIGSIVSEIIAGKGLAIRVLRMGITDKKLDKYGDREWMHEFYGLDVNSLTKTILESLKSDIFEISNSTYSALTVEDFALSFGTTVDDVREKCSDIIEVSNFNYSLIEGDNRDDLILRILKRIDEDNQVIGAPERQQIWERGWEENLTEFVSGNFDLRRLVPKFIRHGQPVRFNGYFIQPSSPTFELDYFSVFRQWLFKTYFHHIRHIYEFGCGTGFNLVELSQIYPDKRLFGLDFVSSSIELVNKIAEHYKFNLSGYLFDMVSPNISFVLEKNSAVLTIGSMEQLASKFEPFVKYLMNQPISICVHVEPTIELYDENNLVDYLAVKFQGKRGYTRNLLPYLRELEAEKRVELLKVKRLNFGSLFMEGYNLIIWRALK